MFKKFPFKENSNYDKLWNRLSNACLDVLKCEVSKLMWKSSFEDVYSIVFWKKLELFYSDTFILIEKHIEDIESELIKADSEILSFYVIKQKTLYKGLENMNCLYRYFNNVYLPVRDRNQFSICNSPTATKVSENNMNVEEMGHELWKVSILKIADKLKRSIIEEIEGVVIDEAKEVPISIIFNKQWTLSISGHKINEVFGDDIFSEIKPFYQLCSAEKSSESSFSQSVVRVRTENSSVDFCQSLSLFLIKLF